MSLVCVQTCVDTLRIKTCNQICFLDISLMFHVSVKHCLFILQGLVTLTHFVIDYIDYHVNKEPHIYSGTDPSHCKKYIVYAQVTESAVDHESIYIGK